VAEIDRGRQKLTPSQGGEPERRRDERRTRRQAGASGNRAQGQCRRTRFSPSAREKGSENAPLAAAAAATATATGAAAASIGLREASRFEQGISPLASSVEMTWVEGRRTRDGHGHGHRKRSTATDEAVPPYLASMSPRASLRVEGSPPSLEWWSLERSSIRRRDLVSAPLAAAATATATATAAATAAAAASIGLREASRFEQGISPLASSVEMTWVEGRRTRDSHGHGHRKRSTATDEAVPPYLASMSPRASLRVEGSPPSLEWRSLERSSIRRTDFVSAPLAASAAATGAAAAVSPGAGTVTGG
jgi:hypothetical protein